MHELQSWISVAGLKILLDQSFSDKTFVRHQITQFTNNSAYQRYLISRMAQHHPRFHWLLKLRVIVYFVSMKFAFSHIAWWIFSCVPRRRYRSFRKVHPDKNRTPGNLRSNEKRMRFMKSIPTYGLINSKCIIRIR